jgi:hypothetical protein
MGVQFKEVLKPRKIGKDKLPQNKIKTLYFQGFWEKM